MFGTLKPALCKLPRAGRTSYRRAYCGTCKALGDGYGQLSRGLLSYDVVFLAHVIEALAAEPAAHDRCRCPLLPVVKRPTLAADSLPVTIAAAVQIVLADQWLDDQVRDGQPLWRPVRALTGPKSTRALEVLADLGIDMAAASRVSAHQAAIEEFGQSVDACAAPTARVLGSLLSQIASLPSIGADAVELAALGEALGEVVYLLDAIEDLESDLERGRFNPCLVDESRLSAARYREVVSSLEDALERVASAVGAIEWRRNRDVLDAVVTGLRRRVRLAIAAADTHVERWIEVVPRPRSWPLRALAVLAAVVTVLWSRVIRQRRRRHPVLAMAGSGTGGGPTILPETSGQEPGHKSHCCSECACDCCGGCPGSCCDCDCTSCDCCDGECCSCDCCSNECGCCSCDCDCC